MAHVYEQFEKRLGEALGSRGDSVDALVEQAEARSLLTIATIEAVRGLTHMYRLAATGRKDVAANDAKDFAVLADATLFAVSAEMRRHENGHPR